jgi:putative transposase
MDCVGCGSAAVTERPDLTAQGYRRFRCGDCGKQFNERSDGVLNRASLPSDIIAFVVFCRLRYRLTLRDLSEILLLRGFTVSHECVRQWEAKLLGFVTSRAKCDGVRVVNCSDYAICMMPIAMRA